MTIHGSDYLNYEDPEGIELEDGTVPTAFEVRTAARLVELAQRIAEEEADNE